MIEPAHGSSVYPRSRATSSSFVRIVLQAYGDPRVYIRRDARVRDKRRLPCTMIAAFKRISAFLPARKMLILETGSGQYERNLTYGRQDDVYNLVRIRSSTIIFAHL